MRLSPQNQLKIKRIYLQKDISADALLISLIFLTYSFFSAPTPDAAGIPEIFLGLMLILLTSLILFKKKNKDIFKYFFIINISFLVTGIGVGAIRGNSIAFIARDAIPWLYIILCFYIWTVKKAYTEKEIHLISLSLYAAGAAFCLRHFFDKSNSQLSIEQIGSTVFLTSGEYFLVEPSVLFMGMLSLAYLYSNISVKYKIINIVFFALFLVSASSQVLRGYLYVSIILLFLLFFFAESRFSKITIGILIAVAFTLNADIERISNVIDIVWNKQVSYGSNSRLTEFILVFSNLAGERTLALFGTGFGGSMHFEYGEFRYTHNFISYVFFKFGIIFGLFYFSAALIFILNIIKKYRADLKDPVLIASLITIIYFMMIQPGYKMLGLFGVLVLTAKSLQTQGRLEKPLPRAPLVKSRRPDPCSLHR